MKCKDLFKLQEHDEDVLICAEITHNIKLSGGAKLVNTNGYYVNDCYIAELNNVLVLTLSQSNTAVLTLKQLKQLACYCRSNQQIVLQTKKGYAIEALPQLPSFLSCDSYSIIERCGHTVITFKSEYNSLREGG